MKKLLTLALALMLVLSLAACGSKPDPAPSGSDTTAPGTSQQEPSNTPDDGDNKGDGTIDRSTVSGFFASYGLTEADIKPDGVGEGTIEANEYIDSQAEVTYKVELDSEKARAWFELLVEATKEASDDGKLYSNTATGKEHPLDIEFGTTASMATSGGWMYYYNGKVAIVAFSTFYGDFDETYFSIELEMA